MEVLLLDPRVDPSTRARTLLELAAATGRLAMLELLLAHPAIDPAAGDCIAVVAAASNGQLPTIDRLFECTSIRRSLHRCEDAVSALLCAYAPHRSRYTASFFHLALGLGSVQRDASGPQAASRVLMPQLRRALDIGALGAAAWARRRAAVLGRAAAFAAAEPGAEAEAEAVLGRVAAAEAADAAPGVLEAADRVDAGVDGSSAVGGKRARPPVHHDPQFEARGAPGSGSAPSNITLIDTPAGSAVAATDGLAGEEPSASAAKRLRPQAASGNDAEDT